MRPVSQAQSAIRNPLNEILGTEAAVRVLRELVAAGKSGLGQATLARQTGITIGGIAKTLGTLEGTGLVNVVAGGSARVYTFRNEHPLASAVAALFRAERERFDEIVSRLAEVSRHLPGPPLSTWIEGPVAEGVDVPADPVVFTVLVSSGSTTEVRRALREPVDLLGEDLDVFLESRVVTKADLKAMDDLPARFSSVINVFGPSPLIVLGLQKPARTAKRKSHADLDADALARAKEIANLIRANPSLIDRAREVVDKRLASASPQEAEELETWRRLLRSGNMVRLTRMMTSATEQGVRLRQSMPFSRDPGSRR